MNINNSVDFLSKVEEIEKTDTHSWQRVDELLNKYVAQKRESSNFPNLANEEVLAVHWKLLMGIANAMLIPEHKSFVVDDNNIKGILFLLYYFNNSPLIKTIDPNTELYLPIYLKGEVGVGKSFLMSLFGEYLKVINSPNVFHNMSITEVTNHQKKYGNIDLFTFNSDKQTFKPKPFHLCLHDLGIKIDQQKTYGTSIKDILDEFLFARCEIAHFYHKKTHITTNLELSIINTMISDSRLSDRMRKYNVVTLYGGSRR